MNIQKILRNTSSYERTFSRMDFDNTKKLRRLRPKLADDLEMMRAALKAKEEHLQRTEEKLVSYEERREQLLQQEKEIVKRLEDAEERDFQDERALLRVQRQLSALEREKQDYQLTKKSLQSWLLDLDRAVGLLHAMLSSVDRNLDRLGIVFQEDTKEETAREARKRARELVKEVQLLMHEHVKPSHSTRNRVLRVAARAQELASFLDCPDSLSNALLDRYRYYGIHRESKGPQ